MSIIHLAKIFSELSPTAEITARANDPAFGLDVESWCKRTGHTLVRVGASEGEFMAVIRQRDSEE